MSLLSSVESDSSSRVPSLASIAAQALLENPKPALKSYIDSSLDQYPSVVKHTTESDISRLKTVMERLEFPESAFIYTTGSDGKHEKANRSESPVELIVVCPETDKSEVQKKVQTILDSHLLPMDDRIEYKTPKDPLITCDITETVVPSRFFHNLRLIGSEEQQDLLTNKFVSEVQNISGGHRKKFNDSFVKRHSKQMRGVIAGKDTTSVDLKAGVLHYSGYNKATKYPLLRPIQYKLDLVLIDAMRAEKKVVGSADKYAKIIKEMPRQVPDQIEYMHKLGLLPKLSPNDVRDLKAAYTLGLFYFQTAQHLVSSRSGEPVSFPIPDKAELAKAFTDTNRILEQM